MTKEKEESGEKTKEEEGKEKDEKGYEKKGTALVDRQGRRQSSLAGTASVAVSVANDNSSCL